MSRAEYKRHAHYGPGGRNCPCCGPSPSERKRADRTQRRVERRVAEREMEREIAAFMTEGPEL